MFVEILTRHGVDYGVAEHGKAYVCAMATTEQTNDCIFNFRVISSVISRFMTIAHIFRDTSSLFRLR